MKGDLEHFHFITKALGMQLTQEQKATLKIAEKVLVEAKDENPPGLKRVSGPSCAPARGPVKRINLRRKSPMETTMPRWELRKRCTKPHPGTFPEYQWNS